MKQYIKWNITSNIIGNLSYQCKVFFTKSNTWDEGINISIFCFSSPVLITRKASIAETPVGWHEVCAMTCVVWRVWYDICGMTCVV